MGILRLLHPFMPFITEEIWQKMSHAPNKWIMTADWPKPDKKYDDAEAADGMEKLIGVITAARNIRAFWNIGHDIRIDVLLSVSDRKDQRLLEENARYVEQLARCKINAMAKDVRRPDQSVASLIGKIRLFIPLGGAVDVQKEKSRITKKIEDIERYLSGIDKKLANKSFLDKAPEDVVQKEKAKKDKFKEQVQALKENLAAIE
jgi:valyl-tRNA synthetase